MKAFTDIFPSVPRRLLYLFYFVVMPYILAKFGERVYQYIRSKYNET